MRSGVFVLPYLYLSRDLTASFEVGSAPSRSGRQPTLNICLLAGHVVLEAESEWEVVEMALKPLKASA